MELGAGADSILFLMSAAHRLPTCRAGTAELLAAAVVWAASYPAVMLLLMPLAHILFLGVV